MLDLRSAHLHHYDPSCNHGFRDNIIICTTGSSAESHFYISLIGSMMKFLGEIKHLRSITS